MKSNNNKDIEIKKLISLNYQKNGSNAGFFQLLMKDTEKQTLLVTFEEKYDEKTEIHSIDRSNCRVVNINDMSRCYNGADFARDLDIIFYSPLSNAERFDGHSPTRIQNFDFTTNKPIIK